MKTQALCAGLLIALALPLGLRAQNLQLSPMVRGERATVAVHGLSPSTTVVFFMSLVGPGPGRSSRQLGLTMNLALPDAVLGHASSGNGGIAQFSFIVPLGASLGNLWIQALILPRDFPQLSASLTPVAMGEVQSLSAFDDDFTGATLSSAWRVHNAHKGLFQVAGGELRIEPTLGGIADIWFNDSEGPMIGRLVRGDFSVVTTVRATRATSSTLLPAPSYNLGGVILRDPNSQAGARNSVHAVLGAGTSAIPNAAEDKNTIGSSSNFLLHPIATPDGQLRLVRSGQLISASYRSGPLSPWQILRSHIRSDLPEVLEVGLMAYSFANPPDIAVYFDDVQFSR